MSDSRLQTIVGEPLLVAMRDWRVWRRAMDVFYLLVVLVFFALTWGLIALFERV